MEEFAQSGAEVVVLAPFDEVVDDISKLGIRCIDVKMSRQGLNPLVEILTVYRLIRTLRKERPDIVFNFSIKPVIYGGIAAYAIKSCHIFSMITGLGHLFVQQTRKYRALQAILIPLYRIAIKRNKGVFFHNPDDKQLFIQHKIIPSDKGYVINGSGINLEHYRPEPDKIEPKTFLLISRLLWSKGIKEYVEAARVLKSKYPDIEFQLLGPLDDNPASVKKSEIEEWKREGVIRYLGSTNDVRPYLHRASVFVLPTWYREGRPRAILEAMSCGKPIITTDTPGCRQTVDHGENGLLVRTRDVEALAAAMEEFLVNDELVIKMGRRSRQLAEEKYSVSKVIDSILSVMTQALAS